MQLSGKALAWHAGSLGFQPLHHKGGKEEDTVRDVTLNTRRLLMTKQNVTTLTFIFTLSLYTYHLFQHKGSSPLSNFYLLGFGGW